MSGESLSSVADASGTVPAGRLAPWHIGQLPEPPHGGWRLWVGLLGPGVVMAGTSIGTGEWLFGPAVSAQYGASLLWLATISIVLQVFCNLLMMRYAIYCGEPILVGGMRTWPGPRAWVAVYLLLDVAAIWPFNASNAAVPLAAAMLGRLPNPADEMLVKSLGFAVFLLAFVPLVFGGTVYRMLEKIMTFKLVVVLGYLTFITVFMVSPQIRWDVVRGFFQFGTYPQRAATIVVDRHFQITDHRLSNAPLLKGTMEKGKPVAFEFAAAGHKASPAVLAILSADEAKRGEVASTIGANREALAQAALLQDDFDRLMRQADALAGNGTFFIETEPDEGVTLSVWGVIDANRIWNIERLKVAGASGEQLFQRLDEVPEPYRARLGNLIEHQGVETRSLVGYVVDNGRLPRLDWLTLAAFTAIAGAGSLNNAMFSNYSRDKGWGMGRNVGAIPSAIGGRTITLSHVGEVFEVNPNSLTRWRGWLRHINRDQIGIWMVASFLGMALPCMMSLEFIRNATVSGNRVAAMTAEGIAHRYPDHATLFWFLTLFCGFLVLAPGQVSVADQIARRWTDTIWNFAAWAKRLGGNKVKYIYYSILAIYAVWGLVILTLFPTLDIARFGAALGNVALGVSALQALYVNRVLLPPELRPNWLLQLGTLVCGVFFCGLSFVFFLL